MKKIYFLFLVFLVAFSASKAQSVAANAPAFDDNIDDVGTANIRFAIYPNPSNGNFRISLESSKEQNTSVVILDTNGKIVCYRRVDSSSENSNLDFNLSNLNKGLYIVKVVNGNTLKTAKLLVQG